MRVWLGKSIDIYNEKMYISQNLTENNVILQIKTVNIGETENSEKRGEHMLKEWMPGEIPEKQEFEEQLDKNRNRLYDLQTKIKEHRLPVLVLFDPATLA